MKDQVNTVIVSLDEYNQLRDFRRDIEEKKVIHLYRSYSTTSVTESNEVHRLNDELLKIHKELFNLKTHTGAYEVEDVNRFSVFEFLKWKRKNRKTKRFRTDVFI